jgi:FixJ family two-component response regulator
MTPPLTAVVFVVDDDTSVRRSLTRLLAAHGHAVEAFASAASYLDRAPSPGPACVVLDVRMPGLSGLELQQALADRGRTDQIVFITGHGSVPMCAQAMKAGAVDFLPKPFTEVSLLDAVARAIERARTLHAESSRQSHARARLARLTPRELEVFRHLIAGKLNKQIGADLGTSEKTIKIQRGSLTAKLGLVAVADMVRLAQQAGVPPAPRS